MSSVQKNQISRLFVMTGLLLLQACSSGQKSSRGDKENANLAPAKPVEAEVKAASNAGLSKEEKKSIAQSITEQSSSQVSSNSASADTLGDAIKAKNEEQIFKSATQILQSSPNDERALNSLALYHFQRGRFSTSKYLLNKAIANGGKSSSLHNNLAVMLLQEGDQRGAIKSLRKAIEINEKDAVANANLGSIYVKVKDYSKARIVLETAVNNGFRDAKTLNNYAVALTAGGKYDQAKSIYQGLLKDSSNNRDVLLNYAILLIDHAKSYQEGLEVINRLKFIGPTSESRNRVSALENKAKAGLQ